MMIDGYEYCINVFIPLRFPNPETVYYLSYQSWTTIKHSADVEDNNQHSDLLQSLLQSGSSTRRGTSRMILHLKRHFINWPWRRSFHVPVLVLLEISILVLYAMFVEFDTALDQEKFNTTIPLFTDVHVMVYLGIGFILTFMNNYSLSALCINFLCGSLAVQWYILVHGFVHAAFDHHGVEHLVIKVSILSFLYGEFAAATVLVTFCVLIGKVTILQLIIMVILEVFFFVLNELIGRTFYQAFDVGDTIFLHVFAAYFGLAASRVLHTSKVAADDKMTTSKTSNIFSLLGTLFLWVFWPSFMASGAIKGAPQQRAMMNTYSAIIASVMGTFVVSTFSNSQGKLAIDHIQNAVLAGGVAIGATADVIVKPYLSILIGIVGGVVSVCGFVFTPNLFTNNLKIHDSCGVHSLHGIPGMIGGIASIGVALTMSKEDFGEDWEELFPAIVAGRSQFGQAIAQVAAILTTLGIAILGGVITGYLMKWAGSFQFGTEFIIPARDRFEDRFCIFEEEDCFPKVSSNGLMAEDLAVTVKVNIFP